MKTKATLKLIGLQFAIPALALGVYWIWAGLQLARDMKMADELGMSIPSRGLLPSWGYVEAVGTLGPVMLLILLTPHVWRASRNAGIARWLGASSQAVLGAAWGMVVFF